MRYFVFISLLAACTAGGHRDIRDYYYPVLDLQGGKVYVYDLAQGDSTAPEYWYYRTFVRDSGIYMAGTYYAPNFQIGQIIREKIVSNGSLARNYFLYGLDSAGNQVQIPATLDAPNLFPFEVTDSAGVFLFRLHYQPPGENATIYLIRNRRYLGDGPDFPFNGKQYPTVRFALRDAVGNEQQGAAEIEGLGEEWWAKDLGLVYYKKSYGTAGQLTYEYKLTEIIEMEELERRAKYPLKTKD